EEARRASGEFVGHAARNLLLRNEADLLFVEGAGSAHVLRGNVGEHRGALEHGNLRSPFVHASVTADRNRGQGAGRRDADRVPPSATKNRTVRQNQGGVWPLSIRGRLGA